jgi:hypothetical protein
MAISQAGITATSLSSGSKHGTVLFTSTGDNAITSIIVCNNTASTSINLSLYVVRSSFNPYDTGECIIVSNLTIPAGETVSFDQEKLVLGDGDAVEGVASVAWTGTPSTGLAVTVSTLPV